MFIGTGTTISIFLVMCVLPQILLTGDIIIRKTSFTISRGGLVQNHSGLIRVDGRVRGQFNGIIDAEVHGFLRGELNARVDMGTAPAEEQLHYPEITGGTHDET